jgi:hypothetical protein
MQWLLDNKADLNHRNKEGNTCLHLAFKTKKLEVNINLYL